LEKNKVIYWIKEQISKSSERIKKIGKAFFNINLSHNTGQKFFSLIIAIFFWLFVMDQVNPEITRVIENVPVNITNVQELNQQNYVIMNPKDYFSDVEITGRRNNIINVNSDEISLWVDLSDVVKGDNKLIINNSNISDEVSISGITPEKVEINIDEIVSIAKPVSVELTGEFATNYYQYSMILKPNEVKVSGPESIVNTVNYIGGSIDVSEVTADLTKDITLTAYDINDEIVNNVNLDINYVNVSLEVGQAKLVNLESTIEGEQNENFRITDVYLTPDSITIKGPTNLINSIDQISVEPVVLLGNEIETFSVEKKVVVPSGVEIQNSSDVIQIELVVEPIVSKDFNIETKDIVFENLNDRFTSTISPEQAEIIVTVIGIQSEIDKINEEDILLYLNYETVTKEGLYKLKVLNKTNFEVDEFIISPEYIECEINLTVLE